MAEIEACSRIGAMLGDGKTNEIEVLSNYGRRLGFLSRLADAVEDVLNIKGDLPNRIKYESVPLPLLYAARSSNKNRIIIEEIINKKKISAEDIKSIKRVCFETRGTMY